jgi:hypothetical protein
MPHPPNKTPKETSQEHDVDEIATQLSLFRTIQDEGLAELGQRGVLSVVKEKIDEINHRRARVPRAIKNDPDLPPRPAVDTNETSRTTSYAVVLSPAIDYQRSNAGDPDVVEVPAVRATTLIGYFDGRNITRHEDVHIGELDDGLLIPADGFEQADLDHAEITIKRLQNSKEEGFLDNMALDYSGITEPAEQLAAA